MRSSTIVTWLRLAWTVSRKPFGCPGRDVEAQERLRREPLAHRFDQRGDRRRRRGGVAEVVRARRALQRHGDARHAEERPFERARHRPRIRHVVAEVVALVDPRDDEIRRPGRYSL